MSMANHIEYEIALSLGATDPESARAWLHDLPNCTYQRSTQLLNVYYDTPEQSLRHAKAALRLRFDTQAQCWIQTLKTAGTTTQGLSARNEWEVILPTTDYSGDTPPDWQFELFAPEAQALLTPMRTSLRAVFHTDFMRDIYDYHTETAHYEWALDIGRVRLSDALANDKHMSVPIKDLEIELKQGELTPMQTLARQAQDALKASTQNLSKAARGYALL